MALPDDNTTLLTDMEDSMYELREKVEDFRNNQNERSDEGNEQHIADALTALDTFEAALHSLVP